MDSKHHQRERAPPYEPARKIYWYLIGRFDGGQGRRLKLSAHYVFLVSPLSESDERTRESVFDLIRA